MTPTGSQPTRVRRGFTIIEIAVVVTFIGILAAILLPVFTNARSKGFQAECTHHLYQVGLALQLYARDHDGYFPPGEQDLRPLAGLYFPDAGVLHCPSDWLPASEVPPSVSLPTGPLSSSYQYQGGLNLAGDANTPVAADWEFRHNDGASVLYRDGAVRNVRITSWVPFTRGARPLPPGVTAPAQPVATPTVNQGRWNPPGADAGRKEGETP
ncbi:MAG: type II secretion system protein [Armatimonadetes bacterium]|nr:type II secretion system protein [Armatimonadota bacterium]